MAEPEVLVTTELTIQHVIDADGETGFILEMKGDPDRTTVIGLLELVKYSFLTGEL